MAPSIINPSLNGLFDADYRFTLNHRTQWRSITVPYQTNSGNFELGLFKNNTFFSSGAISFNNDKAGDSELGFNSLGLSFALHFYASKNNNQTISLAFNSNFTQRKFNVENLTFDNQFNGDAFDKKIPINEYFNNTKYAFVNMALGANYQYFDKDINYINFGFAVYNFNTPNQSFFNNTSVNLSQRYVFYTNNIFSLNYKYGIVPSLIYQIQDKYQEFVIGGLFQYNINRASKRDKTFQRLYFGPFYRFNDAIILAVKYDYKDYRIGISYDINVSKLRIASKSRGAFEISFMYLIRTPNKNKYDKKYQVCPTWM